MELASVPLESGTYIGYAVVHQYHVLQKDDGEAKLQVGLTQNTEREGLKVSLSTLDGARSPLTGQLSVRSYQ